MIRRVRVRGYKSLRDAEVSFPGPLAVVMGPNASGKSNLFDLLALLARTTQVPSLEEAFAEHRGRIVEAFTFGPGGLRESLGREALALSVEVDVELAESAVRATEQEIGRRRSGFEEAKPERAARVAERHLRYALSVEYRPREKALAVRDEQLVALRRDGSVKDSRMPFLSRGSEGGREAIGLRLEGQSARPTEFPVGLPGTVVSQPHYAPHYPHVEAFKRELAGWRFYAFEPRAMRAESDLRTTSSPGRFGEDLAAFYDTLKARAPERFRALQAALAELLPTVERVEIERSDDGFIRLYVTEAGSEIPARLMSEGTLRLLGLLAAVEPTAEATVVGVEEPEGSVHPRRLPALARFLEGVGEAGGFQVVVNTHSPLLASGVPEERLVVCRSDGRGTSFRPFAGAGPLFKPVEIEKALAPGSETSPGDRIARILREEVGE